MNITQHYKDLKRELGGASDTAVALVLLADQVAELTKVVRDKVMVFDGEQVGMIRESCKEIATTVQGVGEMVDNLRQ